MHGVTNGSGIAIADTIPLIYREWSRRRRRKRTENLINIEIKTVKSRGCVGFLLLFAKRIPPSPSTLPKGRNLTHKSLPKKIRDLIPAGIVFLSGIYMRIFYLYLDASKFIGVDRCRALISAVTFLSYWFFLRIRFYREYFWYPPNVPSSERCRVIKVDLLPEANHMRD